MGEAFIHLGLVLVQALGTALQEQMTLTHWKHLGPTSCSHVFQNCDVCLFSQSAHPWSYIESWDPLENYPKEQMNLLAALINQVHGIPAKFLHLAPSILSLGLGHVKACWMIAGIPQRHA